MVRTAAFVAVAAILLGACGMRVPHDELVAAARASGGVPGSAEPGSQSSGGQSTVAQDGTSPTSVGTGVDGGTGPGAAGGTSNTGGTGADPSGGSAGPAQSCSSPRETLTIGAVGEQSGIFGPSLAPMGQMVQAWVNSVNAAGGINCHQLKYIVKNDNGDPATHQSMVRELVEQHNVVAMVMMNAPVPGESSVRYLTDKGIPVIGTAGGEDWYYSSPVYRPQMTTGVRSLEALVYGIAAVGLPQGKRNLGVITCVEVALCSSLNSSAGELSGKAGVNLVFKSQVSILVPADFSSHCQRAQGAGVQLMVVGMDVNSIQRMLAACEAVGFRPLYISGGILITPSLLADPRAAGFLVAPTTARYTDTDNAQIAQMNTVLQQYAPNLPPSNATVVGWAAAQLFAKALMATAEPVTPAGILGALDQIQGDDLGGITAPLGFSPGQPAPTQTCFWLGQVTADGGFGPVPGAPAGRTCA